MSSRNNNKNNNMNQEKKNNQNDKQGKKHPNLMNDSGNDNINNNNNSNNTNKDDDLNSSSSQLHGGLQPALSFEERIQAKIQGHDSNNNNNNNPNRTKKTPAPPSSPIRKTKGPPPPSPSVVTSPKRTQPKSSSSLVVTPNRTPPSKTPSIVVSPSSSRTPAPPLPAVVGHSGYGTTTAAETTSSNNLLDDKIRAKVLKNNTTNNTNNNNKTTTTTTSTSSSAIRSVVVAGSISAHQILIENKIRSNNNNINNNNTNDRSSCTISGSNSNNNSVKTTSTSPTVVISPHKNNRKIAKPASIMTTPTTPTSNTDLLFEDHIRAKIIQNTPPSSSTSQQQQQQQQNLDDSLSRLEERIAIKMMNHSLPNVTLPFSDNNNNNSSSSSPQRATSNKNNTNPNVNQDINLLENRIANKIQLSNNNNKPTATTTSTTEVGGVTVLSLGLLNSNTASNNLIHQPNDQLVRLETRIAEKMNTIGTANLQPTQLSTTTNAAAATTTTTSNNNINPHITALEDRLVSKIINNNPQEYGNNDNNNNNNNNNNRNNNSFTRPEGREIDALDNNSFHLTENTHFYYNEDINQSTRTMGTVKENKGECEYDEVDLSHKNLNSIDLSNFSNSNLAVAIPVNDEFDDEYNIDGLKSNDHNLPAAIEFDPDQKDALLRRKTLSKRICCTSFFFCIAIFICVMTGIIVNVKKSNNNEDDDVHPRETLGIREYVTNVIGKEKILLLTNDTESDEYKIHIKNPYWKALNWTIYGDPLALNPTDHPNLLQRYILAYFYYATTVHGDWIYCSPNTPVTETSCAYLQVYRGIDPIIDANSLKYKHWLSENDECKWSGVTCNKQGQVVELDITGMGFTGTFPEGIKYLPFVSKLTLAEGDLSGTLPSDLGSWKHLTRFEAFRNNFTGPAFPPAWTAPDTKIRNLLLLILRDNRLTGQIPNNITNFHDLTILDLSNNQLTGSFPQSLAEQGGLSDVWLDNNNFTGPIPVGLFSSSKSLEQLFVQKNQFTGSIPSDICTNQVYNLDLSSNKLSGELPASLYNCTNLLSLDLSDNMLRGPINAQIGGFEYLSSLHLHTNQFTGTLPTELGQLELLEDSSFYGNNFSGEVPEEFCMLRGKILATISADCLLVEGWFSDITCKANCCTMCCDPSGKDCQSM